MNRAVEHFDAGGASDAPIREGDRLYRQCSNCGAPIEVTPVISQIEKGAILWCDGYVETPEAAEPPIVGKCRVCSAIGCLVELATMEEVPQLALKGDYTFVPLTVSDYASLLENVEDIATQFHVYLRMRFWQLSNHRRRGKDNSEPLSEIERANLVELLRLLGEEDPDRLVKAEIHRQLGQFGRAEALLAEPVASELTPMIERLRRLLGERNAGIVKIFSGAPGDEIPTFTGK